MHRDDRRILPHPPAPRTLEEAGLSLDLVVQLVLKTLHSPASSPARARAIASACASVPSSRRSTCSKAQHQVEIAGGVDASAAPSYRLPHHRRRPHARGALPRAEPLRRRGAGARSRSTRATCGAFRAGAPRTATRDARPRGLLRTWSSATASSTSSARPSTPATRCSSTARPATARPSSRRRIRKLLDGDIAIPHALEVEGHIIRVFDPVVHEELPIDRADRPRSTSTRHDRRWVRCRRPLVMVGGELTLDALELAYTADSRLLPGAGAGARQRRRAGHRRLRPAAVLARATC